MEEMKWAIIIDSDEQDSELIGWQLRLVVEFREMYARTNKLVQFIKDINSSDKMDMHDWNIITVQRDIMLSYVSILETRLIKAGLGAYTDEWEEDNG